MGRIVIGGTEREERGLQEEERETERRKGRQRVREKTPSSCTKNVKGGKNERSYKKRRSVARRMAVELGPAYRSRRSRLARRALAAAGPPAGRLATARTNSCTEASRIFERKPS